jgi:sugar phosphate isomerase/epimerase
MEIKFGVLSMSMHMTPLEEMLRAIKAIGYQNVHIWCNRPHMYPGDYNKEDRMRIRKLCDDLQLEIGGLDAMHVFYSSLGVTPPRHPFSGLHFPPNPVSYEPKFVQTDPALRKMRVDLTKTCIDMAVEIGAPMVESITGVPFDCYDDIYDTTLDAIKECVEYAEKKKILLVFEMGQNMMFGAVEEMLEIFKIIRSPYLKGCIDLGHSNIEGRTIRDSLAKVGEYLVNFHVDDIRHRKHFHLPAGRGDIDWRDTLIALRDYGYKGYFSVETYQQATDPIPCLTETYNYLTPLINSL